MSGTDWCDHRTPWGRTTARVARILALLGWTVAASACKPHTRLNPDFCDLDAGPDPCGAGRVCDSLHFRCVTGNGAGGGHTGGAGGDAGRGGGGTGGGAGGGGTDSAAGGSGASATSDAGTGGSGASATSDAGAGGSGASAASDAARGDAPSDVPRTCPPCGGTTPICDSATGSCVRCPSSAACAAATPPTPLCDSVGGACVVCNVDADCKAGTPERPWCLNHQACAACRTSADCPNAAPVCDATAHTCGACRSDQDCGGRTGVPACHAADGACVECVTSAHCGVVTRPICATGNNTCAACRTDLDCATKQGTPNPGVCMFHQDGACATDGQVWYVKPASGCDDGPAAAGTAATPFCAIQRAISALTPVKPIIVVRPGGGTSPAAIEHWVYSAVPGIAELTVIGQAGASVGPGSGVGIIINSGDVYIRGLGVSGMFGTGVYVPTGNTILKMDRCIVTQNQGGLFVNGAGFEINNSVFANNSVATIDNPGGAAIQYGGVYLGAVLGKPAVFRNNTIYQNGGPGLVCGGPIPVKGVLVTGNVTDQVVTCMFDGSSEVVGDKVPPYDPQFDPAKPYHLTARSSCVDKGTSMNDAPSDDLDGNPRPSVAGGISDCGAHEFQK